VIWAFNQLDTILTLLCVDSSRVNGLCVENKLLVVYDMAFKNIVDINQLKVN